MLHTKYQDSRPYGFRQEDFSCFYYVSQCKSCDPQGGAIFDPRGIIRTNLVEVHQVMLSNKYQDSTPYGFRQEDFFHGDPRKGPFLTLGA